MCNGYVPLYLHWISQQTLQGLSYYLSLIDERINGMIFYELPYQDVADFDYPEIAV